MDVINQKTPEGKWVCKSLFLEWHIAGINKFPPVFTIQDYDVTKDGQLYKSLYKLYMDSEDPIEFDFANEHMGCYDHWKTLCGVVNFKPEVERWRNELGLKLQARALRLLAAEADSGSKNAYSANKFLVEKGWVPKTPGLRGRPSKEAIAQEADLDKSKILEVYNRLNLNNEPKDLN